MHREALVVDLWKRQRAGRRARHRRRRRGAVGPFRQGGRPADPSPARHLSRIGAGLCQLGRPGVGRGVRRGGACEFKENGWAAYKIHPPTRWREDIKVCEAVRKAVGDYTIMLDSTWAYDYPAAMRVGRAVEELGYLLVRGPAGRPGHLQLREAEAAALDPDPRHRVPDRRPRFLPAVDHAAGHRLPARRRRREGRHHHPGEGARISPRPSA